MHKIREEKEYRINQDTIDSLERIFLDGLTEEENRFINEWIAYTLQYAKTVNDSCEVGIMLDMEEWCNYDIVLGSKSSVSFNTDKMKRCFEEYANRLILIHNHPSDAIFSDRDIFNFCKAEAVHMLIVAGNRGSIYVIRKCENFNKYLLIDYYSIETERVNGQKSRAEILEQTLVKYQQEIGIEYIRR